MEVMTLSKLGETRYVPHHPVIRDDKTTTKILVFVFGASARKIHIIFDTSAGDSGPSLNNTLYREPHLTPLLYDILLRLLYHVFALTYRLMFTKMTMTILSILFI